MGLLDLDSSSSSPFDKRILIDLPVNLLGAERGWGRYLVNYNPRHMLPKQILRRDE